MKYVWIFVVVVILVRIDFFLRLFDKGTAKYESSQVQELKPEDTTSNTELVTVENDLSLKNSPRKVFLSLLDDFQSAPEVDVKERVLEALRAQPTMFNDKLDPELEASIYKWRDLLMQKNKATSELLLELMKSLKGENLEMLKRFFSFSIDADLKEFLTIYSKSSDTNCLLMRYLGDQLTDEEKFNELSERLLTLDAFIATKTPEPLRPFAQRCQVVLKLEVDKLRLATTAPGEGGPLPDSAVAPEAAPTNTLPVTGTSP